MTEKPLNDPVVTRFRAAMTEIHGDRVERVVLFGSRARGDARPDSDYDIAVFLKDAGTFADESARLAAVSTDILIDTGAVISATPFPAGAYRERTGFMHELRKDGLDLRRPRPPTIWRRPALRLPTPTRLPRCPCLMSPRAKHTLRYSTPPRL